MEMHLSKTRPKKTCGSEMLKSFFSFIFHLSILPISNYWAKAALLIAAAYCSRKQIFPAVCYN